MSFINLNVQYDCGTQKRYVSEECKANSSKPQEMEEDHNKNQVVPPTIAKPAVAKPAERVVTRKGLKRVIPKVKKLKKPVGIGALKDDHSVPKRPKKECKKKK